MEITNLETFFNRRKAEYADRPAWQWQDGGIQFALMEYLSHCGEFTEADREFIKANDLEAEADYAQHDNDTIQTDYAPITD